MEPNEFIKTFNIRAVSEAIVYFKVITLEAIKKSIEETFLLPPEQQILRTIQGRLVTDEVISNDLTGRIRARRFDRCIINLYPTQEDGAGCSSSTSLSAPPYMKMTMTPATPVCSSELNR